MTAQDAIDTLDNATGKDKSQEVADAITFLTDFANTQKNLSVNGDPLPTAIESAVAQ